MNLDASNVTGSEIGGRLCPDADEAARCGLIVQQALAALGENSAAGGIGHLKAEAELLQGAPRILPVLHWCQRAHDALAAFGVSQHALIERWQADLLPFFLRGSFLRRCREKPRGYAGDYLTIQAMYDASGGGPDSFEALVDAWAFSQPAPRAVRNRRGLIGGLLQELEERFGGETSVVSLGCGPAAEVFDCLPVTGARFTLVDIDADAIDYVRTKAALNAMTTRIRPVLGNVIRMALRRDDAVSDCQHAIYSLGVVDYFQDEVVVRLLDYAHAKLVSGGVALFGNFRPGHSNATFFEKALDWPLRLRSAEHLTALAQRSAFRGSRIEVGAEPEGVQLFLKCTKA